MGMGPGCGKKVEMATEWDMGWEMGFEAPCHEPLLSVRNFLTLLFSLLLTIARVSFIALLLNRDFQTRQTSRSNLQVSQLLNYYKLLDNIP